jgi:FSR family fosmidomycin resistance protein-like MFS transporter
MQVTSLERSDPTPVSRGATRRIVIAVGIAHFINDAYSSFLSPLLPRLMDNLGMSIAVAASLAMTWSLAASLVQPASGYLADRYGRKLFVIGGPLVSGVFLSLIGLAPSIEVLALILIAGGIGSAAFHPPGAAMSGGAAEGKGSGARMSAFAFGGLFGFAVGPLTVVALVGVVGLSGMWIAMIPAIGVCALLLFVLPGDRPHPDAALPPPPIEIWRALIGPLSAVFVISALSGFIQRLFTTLSPIISFQDGVSEATGAVVLTVYMAGQAVGTIVGGLLTDRMDRSYLLAGLTALALPAHLFAFWLPAGSPLMLAFAAVAGCLNLALMPPVIVLAQEIMPASKGVGSAVVMGLAWAAGSIAVIGFGFLGDAIGPRPAAIISLPLLIIGIVLAFHPTLRLHRKPAHS